MSSLVLELQVDALDEKKSIIFLLQKARVVSVKLNVTTIQEWIQHELEGYPCDDLVPEYRDVVGDLKVRNPIHGFQPLNVGHAGFKKTLTQRKLQNPLPSLVDFLGNEKGSRQIMMGFIPEQAELIMSGMSYPRMEPWLAVELSSIQRIVTSVRTKILDFALGLEQQGILGDGMTFSKDEKERASNITYNINIEQMTGSQIQQGTTSSTQNYTQTTDLQGISAFVEKLLPAIDAMTGSEEREQIRSDLETIRSQIKAPTPKLGMIRECLKSVKTILEGAAGNIVAAPYLQLLTPLLASIPS